jgi:hypothetical protein
VVGEEAAPCHHPCASNNRLGNRDKAKAGKAVGPERDSSRPTDPWQEKKMAEYLAPGCRERRQLCSHVVTIVPLPCLFFSSVPNDFFVNYKFICTLNREVIEERYPTPSSCCWSCDLICRFSSFIYICRKFAWILHWYQIHSIHPHLCSGFLRSRLVKSFGVVFLFLWIHSRVGPQLDYP